MGHTPAVVPTVTRNQTQQTDQGDNALTLLIVPASLTPSHSLEKMFSELSDKLKSFVENYHIARALAQMARERRYHR